MGSIRRFGVIQGEKCRQIDDFSRFFVNGCTTVDEHVDLDGVDQIVNIGKAWIDLIEDAKQNKGAFQARWEDGSVTKHWCHKAFTDHPTQIQGSAIDLEEAYKQCPVELTQSRYGIFAIKNPGTKEVHFFFARALPFGAKSCVHGFNRASRVLNSLLHDFAGAATGTYRYLMISPWWHQSRSAKECSKE